MSDRSVAFAVSFGEAPVAQAVAAHPPVRRRLPT
jgi:hypothetical protein